MKMRKCSKIGGGTQSPAEPHYNNLYMYKLYTT